MDIQEIRCPECGRLIPGDTIISRWYKAGRPERFDVPCLCRVAEAVDATVYCSGVVRVRNYGNQTVAAFMEA